MSKTTDEKKTAEPTEYIVLELIPLAAPVLDDAGHAGRYEDQRHAWLPVLNQKTTEGEDGKIRVFKAKSRNDAIEQHTGKVPRAGKPLNGATPPKAGTFKAVALSSWDGGKTIGPPAQVEIIPTEEFAG